MRAFLFALFLTIASSLPASVAEAPTWQELLDHADSLVAAGYLDSANVVVDEGISQALSAYGFSDTAAVVLMAVLSSIRSDTEANALTFDDYLDTQTQMVLSELDTSTLASFPEQTEQ